RLRWASSTCSPGVPSDDRRRWCHRSRHRRSCRPPWAGSPCTAEGCRRARAPGGRPMPAEPALTPVRPGPRSDRGASRTSAARLEQTAALLAPLVLIVAVATAGGGYDVTTRHIAALAVWLVVVALLVFGAGTAATLGRPIYWSAGLLGGLGLLSAISSLW